MGPKVSMFVVGDLVSFMEIRFRRHFVMTRHLPLPDVVENFYYLGNIPSEILSKPWFFGWGVKTSLDKKL